MLVRFTREAYKSKAEALAGLKSVHWLEADISFDAFLDLYRHGHTAVVSDKKTSGVLVLDLDGRSKAGEKAKGMAQAEASLVHSGPFLEGVKKLFGAREAVRCDSASKTFYKQKLLIGLDYKRDIRGNTDLVYRALRLRFEEAFGIQCDPRMDSWTQLTFGSRTTEDKYLPETEAAFRSGHPSSQPKKAEKEASAEASQGGTRHHTVPTSMHQLNRKYGKHARPGLRLEHAAYYYDKDGRHSAQIPIGKRHSCIPHIAASIAYYAHYCNLHYGGAVAGSTTPFTADDAIFTAYSIIRYQFQDSTQFLASEERYIHQAVHHEWDAIETLVRDHGAEAGINMYAANRSQFRKKTIDGYKPRDTEFAQFLDRHQGQIVDKLSDSPDAAICYIDSCLIPAFAQQHPGCEFASLKRRALASLKRRGIHIATPRHSKWAAIVEAAPKNEMGGPILPRQYLTTPALRAYIKKKGIKNWSWR